MLQLYHLKFCVLQPDVMLNELSLPVTLLLAAAYLLHLRLACAEVEVAARWLVQPSRVYCRRCLGLFWRW